MIAKGLSGSIVVSSYQRSFFWHVFLSEFGMLMGDEHVVELFLCFLYQLKIISLSIYSMKLRLIMSGKVNCLLRHPLV